MFKPFLRSFRILKSRQRLFFVLLTCARVAANLLDVLGLMAIGLLGAALASGLNDRKEASFAGYTITIESSREYLWIVVWIAALFLAKSAISTLLLKVSSSFLASVEGDAALEVAEYIYSADLSRVKQFSRGGLEFVTTQSTRLAITGLLLSGSALLTEGALFVSVVVLFVFVDPSTAAIIAGYFLLLVFSFQLLINQRLKLLGRRLKVNKIRVTDAIYDLTSTFREIVVSSRRGFFLERFGGFRKRNAQDMALQAFLMGLPRFFVETGLMVGVLTIVFIQFLWGNLEESLVTTAVFLAGGFRMMAALLPLQNAVANIKTMGPQANMAQGLIEKARMSNQTPTEPPAFKLDSLTTIENNDREMGLPLEVQSVTFTYPGSVRPAIAEVSLRVPAGGYVAFVGPSGAGKTTLADLILGISSPDSGEIRLGGLEPHTLRATNPGVVGYVPQNPGMVSGTIAENVALGEPAEDIDVGQVWCALDKAELADFVRTLPEGIDSVLGKQSDSLSGGQKQRLGLARALYRQPRLLVLDEATSALDAETEANISATIEKLGQSVTIIVIAHRLSTIQHADVVYVVERGRITAQGTLHEVRRQVPLIEKYVQLMKISPDEGGSEGSTGWR